MSVHFKIPPQSRFLTTSNKFSALYNSIPGGYSFTATASCANQLLIDMQPSTVYFINTMSIGGNISEEQFNEAVNDFPLLYVRRFKANMPVYEKPIPLSNYFDGNEASVFVSSDILGEQVLITLEGILMQTPSLVGVSPVTVQVQFNIFAMDSSYYNAAYRDRQDGSIGQDMRIG